MKIFLSTFRHFTGGFLVFFFALIRVNGPFNILVKPENVQMETFFRPLYSGDVDATSETFLLDEKDEDVFKRLIC